MNKMQYIHKIEYYLALKRKKILICYNMNEPWRHYDKWNKPVIKGKNAIGSYLYRVPRVVKFIEAENRMVQEMREGQNGD